MKPLKGTKTHENLKEAFAGESQANRRYLYFANKADVEGQNDVSANFRSTAEGETGHAHGHLDYLAAVGDPATDLPMGSSRDNLKAAIAGETHEYTDMYPGMAKAARGEEQIACSRFIRHLLVIFDDVRIPSACLLGGEEKLEARLARAREGGRSLQPSQPWRTFEASRPIVGAQAIGIARAAYEFALDYAKERKPVRPGDHREPGHRLPAGRHGDRDRAARMLVYRAAVAGPQRRGLPERAKAR